MACKTKNYFGPCRPVCPRPATFWFRERCPPLRMYAGACARFENQDTGDVYTGCANGSGRLKILLPSGSYLVSYGRGGCSVDSPYVMTIAAGGTYYLGMNCNGRGIINVRAGNCCAPLGATAPGNISVTGPGGFSVSGPASGFSVAIKDPGTYTATMPASEYCQGGSASANISNVCSLTPVNLFPGNALKPDYVCCSGSGGSDPDSYSIVPKTLQGSLGSWSGALTYGAGLFGSGWGACADIQSNNVDDTFLSEIYGTVGYSGDVDLCMPLVNIGCRETKNFWSRTIREENSGSVPVSITASCGFDGWNASVQYMYKLALLADYWGSTFTYWCSICPDGQGNFNLIHIPGTNPPNCTDYQDQGSIATTYTPLPVGCLATHPPSNQCCGASYLSDVVNCAMSESPGRFVGYASGSGPGGGNGSSFSATIKLEYPPGWKIVDMETERSETGAYCGNVQPVVPGGGTTLKITGS